MIAKLFAKLIIFVEDTSEKLEPVLEKFFDKADIEYKKLKEKK